MDISRLANLLKNKATSAAEDYSQLANAYPNLKNFAGALAGNIERNVPTQADLENPEAMQQRAIGYLSPMAGTIKNLNAGLIQKYLKEGKLSPEEMAQYEANALAMETPNFQKYNLENANAQGGTPKSRATDLGFDIDAYHGTTYPDIKQFLPDSGDKSLKTLNWYKDKKNKNDPIGYMNFRSGSFFSPKPEYAESYTSENKGLMYPVKIKTKNPLQLFTENGKYKAINNFNNSKTMDSLILNNSLDKNDINEIAVIDPEQIRSRFAAFDPLRKASPSLLAGGALGSLLLNEELNKGK